MVSRISTFVLLALMVTVSLQQIPNCKTPNAAGDSCDACNDGFSKAPTAADPAKFDCQKCGDKCKKCKDSTTAGEPGECEECEAKEGMGIDTADKKICKACTDTNCKMCAKDPAKCEDCKDNFDLVSDKCVDCKAPCTKCSAANVCTECVEGAYFLDSNQCKACPAGCTTCKDDKECSKCASGFYLGDDQLCTNNCGTGKVGNRITGRCEACPANCVSCTEPGKCDSCTNGFYLSSTQQCTACGANCSSCYSNGRCKTCINDTYVQDDGTCAEEAWYQKWWVWLLIGLGILGLLGALAAALAGGAKKPAQEYGGYQQWDNTSYAPRVQPPSYQAPPAYNSSFRESATYMRPMSPARAGPVVVGPPVRTTYSPGRAAPMRSGYELQQGSRMF